MTKHFCEINNVTPMYAQSSKNRLLCRYSEAKIVCKRMLRTLTKEEMKQNEALSHHWHIQIRVTR
jgi:hypothetical protein